MKARQLGRRGRLTLGIAVIALGASGYASCSAEPSTSGSGGTHGGGGQEPQCGLEACEAVPTEPPGCDECIGQHCAEECQALLAGYSDAMDVGQCGRNCQDDYASCVAQGGDIGDCNVSEATCSQNCPKAYPEGAQICGSLGECRHLWCRSECCTPTCGAAVCGDDGCGSTCGTCGDTEYCVSGQCCVKQDHQECCADPSNYLCWYDSCGNYVETLSPTECPLGCQDGKCNEPAPKKCGEVETCAINCSDSPCIEACAAAGTNTAIALWNTLWACVVNACPSCSTAPKGSDCLSCQIGNSVFTGICAAQETACENDQAPS